MNRAMIDETTRMTSKQLYQATLKHCFVCAYLHLSIVVLPGTALQSQVLKLSDMQTKIIIKKEKSLVNLLHRSTDWSCLFTIFYQNYPLISEVGIIGYNIVYQAGWSRLIKLAKKVFILISPNKNSCIM